MGLTAKEKKMLEKLQQKAEEPDPAPVNRSLSATIDLGNAEQVKLAKRYGFLPNDDDDDDDADDAGDDGDDDGGDEKPKRRGYFGDS